ncbi:MAG: hypothetical protein V3R82_03925 [Candidatus Hydrothermarchaeales archaeon]
MKLINQNEKKYLYFLVLIAIIFSIWFYLGLTSGERFSLAHGYGLVSQTKELIGNLGIAAAFVVSLIYYQNKRTKGFLLLTIGFGFILTRTIVHSSHMLNAMEQNSSFFEAIFEGENHYLQSILDVIGAIFLALGVTTFLDKKDESYKLLTSVVAIEVGLLALVLLKAKGDMMFLLNNMASSHGTALLPSIMAVMPFLGFLALTILAFELYREKDTEFNRLLFLGVGLIFLRTLVHGVHTVFGIETHFFQSGFDVLGGIVISAAYYQVDIGKREDRSMEIWIIVVLLLIIAIIYSVFTFFRFR